MPLPQFPGSRAPSPAKTSPAAPQPSQAQRDTDYLNRTEAQCQQEAARQAPSTASQQRPAPASARAPSSYPDVDGFDGPPPEDAGGGSLPYASTFDPLRAGNYRFLCCVEQIAHWESGPQIVLRVRVGNDAGREFKWDQSPPFFCYEGEKAENAMKHWKRGIFGAYAAGGWTHDPNPEIGWEGWPTNNSGALVPPYVDFFVVEVNGQVVPVMLAVTVSVQAGYEKYPKIIAVKQHLVDGALVQAPMPRKVTPWIAQRHRWEGTREDITIKPSDSRPNGATVPSTKLRYDQLPLGVGGMKTLKDCRP